MQIPVRRAGAGFETFFNGQWTPVAPEWISDRQRDGHTIVLDGTPVPPSVPVIAPSPSAPAASAQAARPGQAWPGAPVQQGRPMQGAAKAGGSGLTNPRTGQPYTAEQLATLYNLDLSGGGPLTAPNGKAYTPQQLQTLYGTPPAGNAPASALAPPPPAADPANPGLVWDEASQSYRDTRDPYARPAPAQGQGQQPQGPPPASAPAEYVNPNAPGMLGDRALNWYGALGGDVGRYARGGVVPRYAGGGMTRYAEGGYHEMPDGTVMADAEMQGANAIVGEGMERDYPDLDKPSRTELIIPPEAQKLMYWAEGAQALTLPPETMIVPVASRNEQMVRERLLPASQMKQPKGQRDPHTGEEIAPPPNATPDLYAQGGIVEPSATLLPPPVAAGAAGGAVNPWAGLQYTGFSNLNQFARASDAAKRRYDQMLKAQGNLEGAQGQEHYLRSLAPIPLALGSYA